MSEDRDQIIELVFNYGWALDTCDWDLMTDCLTPDLVWAAGPGEPHVGRDERIDYLRDSRTTMSATQHLLTNFVVEQDGDRRRVRCLTQAQHCNGPALFTTGGSYDLDVVRTPEGWRIARMEYGMMWSAGDPAVIGKG